MKAIKHQHLFSALLELIVHLKRVVVCQHMDLNPFVEGLLNDFPPLPAVIQECWQLFKQWTTPVYSLSFPCSRPKPILNVGEKNRNTNVPWTCTDDQQPWGTVTWKNTLSESKCTNTDVCNSAEERWIRENGWMNNTHLCNRSKARVCCSNWCLSFVCLFQSLFFTFIHKSVTKFVWWHRQIHFKHNAGNLWNQPILYFSLT